MKHKFLKNNSNELVVFFLGWGMDPNPMRSFFCDKNIVYFYDYSELDLNFDFSGYEKLYLIAYSAGVFVVTLLQDLLPTFELKCAVNGTFRLFDEKLGLPSDVVKVFENINMENYMIFRRKFLVKNDGDFSLFNKNSPQRSIESCFEELENLKRIYKSDLSFEYDKIFVSSEDKIIPTQNQIEFWKSEEKAVNMINSGHFPFFELESIQKIL